MGSKLPRCTGCRPATRWGRICHRRVSASCARQGSRDAEDEDEDVDDDWASDVGYASDDDEVASSDDDAPLHLKMLLSLSDEDVDFDWPDLRAGEHTELPAASGMR